MAYQWGEGQSGGRVQSPQKVAQPNWATYSVLPLLASAFKKMQEDKQNQQLDARAAFPTLVAARMAQPAAEGSKGGVPFMGKNWDITPPGLDWDTMNKEASYWQTKQKMENQPLEHALDVFKAGVSYNPALSLQQMNTNQAPEQSMMDVMGMLNMIMSGGMPQGGITTPQAQGMIRVKRKSDKQPGSIPLAEYQRNSHLYERMP